MNDPRFVPVVAVAGASGVGKTTLTARVASRLSTTHPLVVRQDHYFLPEASVPRANGTMLVDWDSPEAIDWVGLYARLVALRDDPVRHCPMCSQGKQQQRQRHVVLTEGFLALWDERVRGLYDVVFFLEADYETLRVRRLQRPNVDEHAYEEHPDYWRTIGWPRYLLYNNGSSSSSSSASGGTNDAVVRLATNDAKVPLDDLVNIVWGHLERRLPAFFPSDSNNSNGGGDDRAEESCASVSEIKVDKWN